MNSTTKNTITVFVSLLINVAIACGIIFTVSRCGILFRGSDSMYHVYRGDWLLKSVEAGDIWPLYNPVWYNGVELMRYWPPIAAYLMAFCQFIARSLPVIFTENYVFEGFAVYCGAVYFIGSLSWTVVGIVKDRRALSVVLGILWFFMPQSLHVLFAEGNLPRILIMSVFPLAFLFINEYLKKGGVRNFIGTAVTFFIMCACHVGYTGMVALACLLYLLVYRLCCFTGMNKLQKSGKRDLELIVAVLAGFLLSGVFLFPALKGGLASNTSNASQAAEGFFQSIFITINPVKKIQDGYSDSYFGIVLFLLSLFGAIASKKRARAGFITAIIIVLLTSKTAAPIIQSMPGGSLMWMMRFLQIAQAMILFSMLEWDSLKKPLVVAAASLLTLDCALSTWTLKPGKNVPSTVSGYFENMKDTTLIDAAKAITQNRIAVIDSSKALFNNVFYLTDYDDSSANQLFGQGWEASSTSLQIAQINEAFDYGYYYFMFDRLLEFGCDTVLVKKDAAAVYPYNEKEAELAATARGYVNKYDEGRYVVYHYDGIEGNYGTVSSYEGIAIGNGAYYISMMFPKICEAPSEYIDDFTLEELSSYDIIYLDGFLYHDVEVAEDLITKASESGTRVYVLADGIPENYQSKTNRFLGVECQSVQFDNGFPAFHTKPFGDIELALFPKDIKDWKTVYMNGLTEVLGWSEVLGEEMPFWGKGTNDNINFIGFNLTYYYSRTRDIYVGEILAGIVDVSEYELPERKIVPIDITYGENSITVNSPEDNVNTSLAEHDIFRGNIRNFNRLVYVDSGETVITYKYPYLAQGCLVSFAGLVITGIMVVFISRKRKNDNT